MDKTATFHLNHKEGILQLVKRLVQIPSTSGTNQENDMASGILEILNEIPYFQKHKELLFQEELPEDLLKRKNIAALLKGNGKSTKTIILLSHYDVVGVEDYGHLRNYAFEPDLYREKLMDETLTEEVNRDLHSGNWLFGRGSMDMKAGLALHIALLSEFCLDDNFDGNILLLSTPDEERNSAGMLAAINLLARLKEEFELDYQVSVCSESSFASYPGDYSKYIYLGSVGKLLPLIFCQGKETHVGEPLEGMNASWMASVFTTHMELSPRFVDQVGKEKNPPPTILKLTDSKDDYNVQTPTQAYALYNVLTLIQSPEEVMAKLIETAEESCQDIFQKLTNAFQSTGYPTNTERLQSLKPRVYTYSVLYQLGKEKYGEPFIEEINAILAKTTTYGFDYRKQSVELAKTVSGYFTNLAPFYLLMYAPPYYPHVSLQEGNPRDQKLLRVAESIRQMAAVEFNEEIKLKTFFTGLSDVSYCRLLDANQVIPTLEKEMPLYGKQYRLPLKEIELLDIPTINLGPYGKDAHKRTERLELRFSTEILPKLLIRVVKSVL